LFSFKSLKSFFAINEALKFIPGTKLAYLSKVFHLPFASSEDASKSKFSKSRSFSSSSCYREILQLEEVELTF